VKHPRWLNGNNNCLNPSPIGPKSIWAIITSSLRWLSSKRLMGSHHQPETSQRLLYKSKSKKLALPKLFAISDGTTIDLSHFSPFLGLIVAKRFLVPSYSLFFAIAISCLGLHRDTKRCDPGPFGQRYLKKLTTRGTLIEHLSLPTAMRHQTFENVQGRYRGLQTFPVRKFKLFESLARFYYEGCSSVSAWQEPRNQTPNEGGTSLAGLLSF